MTPFTIMKMKRIRTLIAGLDGWIVYMSIDMHTSIFPIILIKCFKKADSHAIVALNFSPYECVGFAITDRKPGIYEILRLLGALRRLYPHSQDLK
jgi:hypothetical protein